MSSLHERVRRAMLSSVPADGAAIGNTALRRAIEGLLQAEGLAFGDDDYWQAHAALIAEEVLAVTVIRGLAQNLYAEPAPRAETDSPESTHRHPGGGRDLPAEPAHFGDSELGLTFTVQRV